MARAKRRWIPFGVHQSGPYSRLTEMQKAFYLELWMIAEQSNEIPNDLDAIRHMLGRGGQGARTKKAVESFIECGLISVAVDGRWILTEPRDLSYLGAKKSDPITTQLQPSYDQVSTRLQPNYNQVTTQLQPTTVNNNNDLQTVQNNSNPIVQDQVQVQAIEDLNIPIVGRPTTRANDYNKTKEETTHAKRNFNKRTNSDY